MNVGPSTIEEVRRSAAFLAEADLEVAESNEQIVAAREQQLEIAKEVEARATKKVAVGSMTPLDKQLATYSRLGTEIKLLKAKQGGN